MFVPERVAKAIGRSRRVRNASSPLAVVAASEILDLSRRNPRSTITRSTEPSSEIQVSERGRGGLDGLKEVHYFWGDRAIDSEQADGDGELESTGTGTAGVEVKYSVSIFNEGLVRVARDHY